MPTIPEGTIPIARITLKGEHYDQEVDSLPIFKELGFKKDTFEDEMFYYMIPPNHGW